MDITLAAGELLAPADALAVVLTADAPTTLPPALDDAFDGGLSQLLTDDEFKAATGTKVVVRTLGRIPARTVILVGGGEGRDNDLRIAAGVAASAAREARADSLRLLMPGGGAQLAVEGVLAGDYRYVKYKSQDDDRRPGLSTVDLLGTSGESSEVARGQAIGAARNLARDLVNGPAAEVYPESLAAVASGLSTGRIKVEVWDEDRLRSEGMGGIAAVGQGSDRPPRFVHITYDPPGEPVAEVAIVGKGVTFDAGGLSIKPTSGMLDMKCDMGGSATVVGVMSAVESLGIKARVHGIFGAAENMVSGNSYKLGDVLTMRNGKTVEIHNTDAEGRLLLADCLSFASELPVTHIIDLATLTGAAVVALGEHYTAVYANDDSFAGQLLDAARSAGEGFWHMPLEALYNEELKSEVGDIKNVGSRWGGSITAALFLQNFVGEGKTWSHLDIAGPAFIGKPEHHLAKGGTGAGVPALLTWLQSLG